MADEPKPTAQEEFRQFRRAVEPMAVCWACHYHVYPGTQSCPHCGANVPQHAAKRAGQLRELVLEGRAGSHPCARGGFRQSQHQEEDRYQKEAGQEDHQEGDEESHTPPPALTHRTVVNTTLQKVRLGRLATVRVWPTCGIRPCFHAGHDRVDVDGGPGRARFPQSMV